MPTSMLWELEDLLNGDLFWVGGRLKALAGTEYLHSRERDIALTTEADHFDLTLERNYVLESSSFLEYRGIDDVNLDWDPTVFPSFFNSNSGWAFDLMASYQAKDDWTIFASIQDIGSISWDNRTTRYSAIGETNYSGIDILDFLSEDGQISIKDSLYGLLDFAEESDVSFSSQIPSYFYSR